MKGDIVKIEMETDDSYSASNINNSINFCTEIRLCGFFSEKSQKYTKKCRNLLADWNSAEPLRDPGHRPSTSIPSLSRRQAPPWS